MCNTTLFFNGKDDNIDEERKYVVYIHQNKINKKVYVGITKRALEDRWRKEGKGYKSCTYFYNAIQKYGWENFEHIVLIKDLDEKEACKIEENLISVIKKFYPNNVYNLASGGIGGDAKETVEIDMFDLNGNFVKTFERIGYAAKAGDTYCSSVIACCKGRRKRAKEYTYRYHSEHHIQLQPVKKEYGHTVTQYDLKGNKIKTYHRVNVAIKETGITSIGTACLKGSIAGGYFWCYDDEKPILKNNRGKFVYKYNKDYNLIETYLTITEAANENGISISGMRNRINKCKIYEGYYWKTELISKER